MKNVILAGVLICGSTGVMAEYVEDPKPTSYIPIGVIDFVEMADAGERFEARLNGHYFEPPSPYNILIGGINIELSGYWPQFIEGRGLGRCDKRNRWKDDDGQWHGIPTGADPEEYCQPNVPLGILEIKTDGDIRISEITLSNKYGEEKLWQCDSITTSATVYDSDTNWNYEYGRDGRYHISKKVEMDFIIREEGEISFLLKWPWSKGGGYIKSMTIERGVYDSGAPSVPGGYRPGRKPSRWFARTYK